MVSSPEGCVPVKITSGFVSVRLITEGRFCFDNAAMLHGKGALTLFSKVRS